ncbi:ferredoxin isoform X1 [Olea europaea subsp. europaea]|uniref:Ferredoxin isoform X1 n=1 Tax=Olea europaea subsp. europaea TaxID=158383 RepID=A0A8S0R220_OLEEU|nr:ferredoxin isoform X1 [Olea europaea subsp. europaea]
MDLLQAHPYNACTSIYPKPPLHRRPFFSNSITLYPLNSLKTTSELRAQVAVTGQNGTRYSLAVPTHKVTVHDRQRGVVHEFFVPEDQYILHTAESQNINLPFACRHGILLSFIIYSEQFLFIGFEFLQI